MTHITIEREKLERVLEALEVLIMKHYELTGEVLHKETYAVLEEALAQPAPVQEPAQHTWVCSGDLADLNEHEVLRVTANGQFVWGPNADRLLEEADFSSSPALPHILRALRRRTWVGLTADEYAELAQEYGPFPINQIEAKLKEKNT